MPEIAVTPSGNGTENEDNVSAELEAMMKVSDAINSLNDPAARDRVLSWAVQKYQQAGRKSSSATSQMPALSATSGAPGKLAREIPGIARLSDTGELHLTVRDMKARSTNDAALRIAHLLIFASDQLTGSGTISSKGTLVPTLRKYRAYDGNTRTVLARHRGLIREGDQISMDLHCKQEAENFIAEILDASTEGTWKPSAKSAKKKMARETVDEQVHP